jgi:hypothetical protein
MLPQVRFESEILYNLNPLGPLEIKSRLSENANKVVEIKPIIANKATDFLNLPVQLIQNCGHICCGHSLITLLHDPISILGYNV